MKNGCVCWWAVDKKKMRRPFVTVDEWTEVGWTAVTSVVFDVFECFLGEQLV